jgi:hypothetical protein
MTFLENMNVIKIKIKLLIFSFSFRKKRPLPIYMQVKNKSWFFYNMVTSRNGNSSEDAGSLSGLSTQWDQISKIRQK